MRSLTSPSSDSSLFMRAIARSRWVQTLSAPTLGPSDGNSPTRGKAKPGGWAGVGKGERLRMATLER